MAPKHFYDALRTRKVLLFLCRFYFCPLSSCPPSLFSFHVFLLSYTLTSFCFSLRSSPLSCFDSRWISNWKMPSLPTHTYTPTVKKNKWTVCGAFRPAVPVCVFEVCAGKVCISCYGQNLWCSTLKSPVQSLQKLAILWYITHTRSSLWGAALGYMCCSCICILNRPDLLNTLSLQADGQRVISPIHLWLVYKQGSLIWRTFRGCQPHLPN